MTNDQTPSTNRTTMPLLRPSIVLFVLLTFITGVAYPLAVTGIGCVLFPDESTGSVIGAGKGRRASELIGQPFTGDRYFWPRPSATGQFPYNPLAGSGSNLGPTSPVLAEQVARRAAALRAAHPEQVGKPIPADLLTASASGLDPHLSPAAVEYQIARVARARGMSDADLRRLVQQHTEPRSFGLLGEDRVNVLKLNLDLDGRAFAASPHYAGSRWPYTTH